MISETRAIPWVEKYRPRSLKDVASQTLTIQSLTEFVEKGVLPHLIFTGPAGTGKTSTALALIKDILGEHNITPDVLLERNASDESRMKDLPSIKNFVNHIGITDSKFKFVLLDEADNLSRDVQSAFRRIIEMAPANTKFIFMCNFVEHIIDPILSRCAIFRFYPLPRDHFDIQMHKIIKQEGLKISEGVLDAIYFISEGDMRQSINLLQMIVALLEDENGEYRQEEIDTDVIYTISGYLPHELLQKFMGLVVKGRFIAAIKLIQNFKGLSSRGLIKQVTHYILENKQLKLTFPRKENLLIRLAEFDYRLTLEADYDIQLDGLVAELVHMMEGSL